MKKILLFVLTYALLNGFNLFSQESGFSQPEIRIERNGESEIIKIIEGQHCPYDISNNKKHVVIQGYTEAASYYWSEETGGIPFSGYGFAVSDEGVVAGWFTNESGCNVAGLWYPTTQEWEFLGMNPVMPEFGVENFDYNGAWTMSDDGEKIGVMQYDEAWNTGTFIWTKREGYVQLSNGGSSVTRPNGMSSDGSVVAGIFVDDMGYRAPCYWLDGELHQISSYLGEAMNVSPDGRYICGALKNSKNSAFIYDITEQDLTMIDNTLTDIAGSMTALCVTDKGDAFGYISTGNPADYTLRRGFAYVEGELMTFEDYLMINGVQEADSWKVYSVNNVTPDGKTFIGAASMKNEDYTFALTIPDAACKAPSNLTYSIDEKNYKNVILNWDAPDDTANVTYEIYTSYTAIDPIFYGLTETTFPLENMTPGYYTFLVRANYGDCLSNPTNAVNVTIYPCSSDDMCKLEFNMLDGYGDGWNGAYIEIVGENNGFSYSVTVEKEGLETIVENVSLCPDNYTFVWHRGEYDEEISFSIIFDGAEIYKADTGDIDYMFEVSFLEYEVNCNDTESIYDIEQKSSISVHPNPVEDILFIETEMEVVEVAVYDVYGRKLSAVSYQQSVVDVAGLNSGVYFVKVKTDNGETIKRFVKE